MADGVDEIRPVVREKTRNGGQLLNRIEEEQQAINLRGGMGNEIQPGVQEKTRCDEKETKAERRRRRQRERMAEKRRERRSKETDEEKQARLERQRTAQREYRRKRRLREEERTELAGLADEVDVIRSVVREKNRDGEQLLNRIDGEQQATNLRGGMENEMQPDVCEKNRGGEQETKAERRRRRHRERMAEKRREKRAKETEEERQARLERQRIAQREYRRKRKLREEERTDLAKRKKLMVEGEEHVGDLAIAGPACSVVQENLEIGEREHAQSTGDNDRMNSTRELGRKEAEAEARRREEETDSQKERRRRENRERMRRRRQRIQEDRSLLRQGGGDAGKYGEERIQEDHTHALDEEADFERLRSQVRRALEDEETRRSRTERNRATTSGYRALEGIEERATRNLESSVRMWELRVEQDNGSRLERQDRDRERTQLVRGQEGDLERNERRQRDLEARRRRRTHIAVFEEEDTYISHGKMDVECSGCGALRFALERIQSSSERNPVFSNCCQNGNVVLPRMNSPPQLLKELLEGSSTAAKRFLKDIRSYNTVLSMASVSANWVSRGAGDSRFNPTMTLQGRIYHQFGGLLPPVGQTPAFLSVYIFDSDLDRQTNARVGVMDNLDRELLRKLAEMLQAENPYVQSFASLRDWAFSDGTVDNISLVIHADQKPSGEHPRRYNLPECSEVAAIVPGMDDGQIGKRDIRVRRRIGNGVRMETIPLTHRSHDPLVYVLFFPGGRDGWHLNMERADGKKMTPLMFYSWHLFQRSGEFNPILYGRRLFQQYLVDQFCKMESERLNWLRMNQAKLRASDYTALTEALADSGRAQDEVGETRAGKLIVLPSTFHGGDRFMRQQLQDMIAISNKLGHPDVFLTVTCNPKWPEITDSLLPNQRAQDRPDITARVFRMKLKAILDFVVHGRLCGTVVAYVSVVEFQKRGLPHAHIILILDQHAKHALQNPLNVDRLISAEIPPESEPRLRQIVLNNMIHGPCGDLNPSSPCMKDGKCAKRFPKSFRPETGVFEDEYYILYKRRSPETCGGTVKKKSRKGNRYVDMEVDNSWVVPYNPKILRRFECHANMELCISRVGSIKYLFKYVCKGQDRITMELLKDGEVVDEIRNFQDARYVSASEAAWRLLDFNIVKKIPSVTRLTVHLPDHHTVYFREGQEQAAASRDCPGTTLTEWFKANEAYPEARHIRYDEFPRYFTWSRSAVGSSSSSTVLSKWKPRAQYLNRFKRTGEYSFEDGGKSVVGRIYTVSPKEGERYYLRVLLTQLTGATSFQDLRTVQGEVHETYRDVCLALGLLSSDREWKRALAEAYRSSFVPLTKLYATILAYCQPSSPQEIYNSFKSRFVDDFKKRHRGLCTGLSSIELEGHVLREISEDLTALNADNLVQQGLPDVPENLAPLARAFVAGGDTAELRMAVDRDLPRLNEGQRNVFQRIVLSVIPRASLEDNMVGSAAFNIGSTGSNVFFLDAPGGTGKTFLINTIQAYLKLRRKRIVAVASSAVAAILLRDGRTAHSKFKIPIPISPDATCHISVNSRLGKELKEVDMIIWDEIGMAHRHNIEAVDRTLRDICNINLPFGGKTMLMSGDFRQILPVIRGGSRGQIVSSTLKWSPLYGVFERMNLTENMRLSALRDDRNADRSLLEFPKYLLSVGEGRVGERQEHGVMDFLLPSSVVNVSSLEDLISFVYGNIAQHYRESSWLTSRAILCVKNASLSQINEMVGRDIPGEYMDFTSLDKVANEEENALRYPLELLNSLEGKGSLPDHRIRLKTGFIVMLLRNLDTSCGHCNGARYLVEGMNTSVLFLSLATGPRKGEKLALPRMPCSPGDDSYPVPGFVRVQFPVRVCFAMTTNKSQGQSFAGRLGLDLSSECFSHGQLYVALSRTTHPGNVAVFGASGDRVVKNVVYPEVLSR